MEGVDVAKGASRDLTPLAVLADDLTGAMDAGLQFALSGLETLVQVGEGHRDTRVLVMTSESRELTPSEAVARVRQALPQLDGRRIYKKIDSTLRGPVGYELRALLYALALRGIVVSPAFPEGGRTTLHGDILVQGQPLAQSAIRSDPRWPMTESHLPTLLMQQSGMEAGHIPLDAVTRGPGPLRAAITACRSRLVVVDACTEGDLRTIAFVVHGLGAGWLPCGSAGLAKAWASLYSAKEPGGPVWTGQARKPLLLISGSRNPTSMVQVRELERSGIPAVQLSSQRSYTPSEEIDRLAQEVTLLLRSGSDVILESSSTEYLAGGGHRVAAILAEAACLAIQQDLVGGLFITGGEVALAVCHAVGADAVRILEAIEPGVPGGLLIGGLAEGLPVVTKAGGFGSPSVMLDARHWLRQGAKQPRAFLATGGGK
ncbi:MAG: four-carbon acid sugar kinase family protein [Chloroflexi bacterium]|nr:four-carbon acid sugar kinase family protein [Chloroflexota bacterium]